MTEGAAESSTPAPCPPRRPHDGGSRRPRHRHFSPTRELAPGRATQIWIADVDAQELSLVHTDDDLLLEAPNWTPDGAALVLNGDGAAWRLELATSALSRIPIEVPPLNNDHVIHPDGDTLLLSAMDGHLYRVALGGGPAQRLTHDDARAHFLHGVSPDGTTLACVEIADRDFADPGRLALMDIDGGNRRLLHTGDGHVDGPEFDPSGEWIYLNTEAFTREPGHAQLARIRPDGTGFERLLDTPRVDRFPHVSPDGRRATYLSFPAGTLGHPADLAVEIRAVDLGAWDEPLLHIALSGGQGSLNVDSWAPDGRRFAFVAYPSAGEEGARVVARR
ncbi:TolB family protein [Agilicoccus flavus]|uniref:TolB family protein n=1 Tax=Agilicoccus flavus TaxID=2775968 RepID=UPI001CF69338|nr:biopolymer transporter Tol [Agilicoccus flavus]